jgi:hypothetical protein
MRPQLIAEAIASTRCAKQGICRYNHAWYCAYISVTEERVDTITYVKHPPNQIVVDKHVPPVPHWRSYMSDGTRSWGVPCP